MSADELRLVRGARGWLVRRRGVLLGYVVADGTTWTARRADGAGIAARIVNRTDAALAVERAYDAVR